MIKFKRRSAALIFISFAIVFLIARNDLAGTLYKKQRVSLPQMTTLETSALPIDLDLIRLNDFYRFPEAGGAILQIEDSIVIMDRLGVFYRFKDNKLKMLDFPPIPNFIVEYIAKSRMMANATFNTNDMRATSFAYDQQDKKLYAGYTEFVRSDCNKFSIAFIRLNDFNAVGGWRKVYSSDCVPPEMESNGGGGKLLINKHKLYFTVGYPNISGFGSGEYKGGLPNSQDWSSSFGKVFEYDLRSHYFKILANGFRNPQGLAFINGRLYGVDQGPQGGDEVNLVESSHNYGWPFQTFGTRYGTYDYNWLESKSDKKTNYSEPIFSFVPSVGISSVYGVEKFNDRWNGDLVVGSLKGQSLFRLKIGRVGGVILSEPIWIGHRIRDISMFNGQLVLLTDDSFLIFLKVNQTKLRDDHKKDDLYYYEPKLKPCLVCHGFGQTTPSSLAPSLNNLINKRIASDSFFQYSLALKNKKGIWTEDELIRFISNPQKHTPGSSMPSLGLSESEAKDVVSLLKKH